MYVGDRVKVVKLERPSPDDRTEYLEQIGELIFRMNVGWERHLGALWRVRFPDGREAVFSESEVVVLDDAGNERSEIEEVQEVWGVAPRQVSLPFRKRGGRAGSQAVLAFLAFLIAGVLLIGAGVVQQDLRLAAAGGGLIVIGLAAAAVLVS